MNMALKKPVLVICLALVVLLTDHFAHFSEVPSLKIYDAFSSFHQRSGSPPAAIKDIVLVGIDSDTVAHMKERWPYSRKTFARVINHLKGSGAKTIGFDFNFFGDSTEIEDSALRRAIIGDHKVILGAALTQKAGIQFSTLSGFSPADFSGLVNKFQDSDGVTRRALTYLVSTHPQIFGKRFYSWELKILETAGEIDLNSLQDEGNSLSFQGKSEAVSALKIPVDPVTKTFTIHFQAHTKDFERLSFYQVLTGDFDPKLIRGKIILIGFLSEMFQDLHRTPIGWLPGVTLNANALLTLHSENFLRPVPKAIAAMLTLLGALVLILFATELKKRTALKWLFAALLVFIAVSYLLFTLGYVWNYGLFPIIIIVLASLIYLTKQKRLGRH